VTRSTRISGPACRRIVRRSERVLQGDLSFAELQLTKKEPACSGSASEGTNVLTNLDIVAAARRRRIALDRTFMLRSPTVSSTFAFIAQRGDAPIITRSS